MYLSPFISTRNFLQIYIKFQLQSRSSSKNFVSTLLGPINAHLLCDVISGEGGHRPSLSVLYSPIFFYYLCFDLIFDGIIQIVEKVKIDEGFQLIDGHRRRLQILMFWDILHSSASRNLSVCFLGGQLVRHPVGSEVLMVVSEGVAEVGNQLSIFSFFKNWNNPINTIPSSFTYVAMSSPTMTIFLNESSIFLKETSS